MNEGEAPRAQIYTLSSMEPGGAPSPPGANAKRSFYWMVFFLLWNQGGAPSPPWAYMPLMCMYQVMYVRP